MPATKPFSQACENNKLPILQIINQVFTQPNTVWEIGSGTGQHACFFASQLPHLIWQATDRIENLAGIQAWIEEANLANLKPPLALDINDTTWPCQRIDCLFSANTLHIMSLTEVEMLFERLSHYLSSNALACFYGPFNYQGEFTSDSNARFDQWLKAQNPLSGIRDFEYICHLAASIGLKLLNDHAMPANNRLLVFQNTP
jgi:cyclopropane fatty-acyl-phospholipid synthase-like methyltransferase